MTPAEAMLLLGVIKRIYPMQEISAPIAETWAAILHDLSSAEAQQAAYAYMRTGGEFPPKPAQLLAILSRELVGSSLIPEEAWSEVMSEVRRVGLHPLPVWADGRLQPAPTRTFSSPLIERAVRALGWDVICLSEADDIPTLRAQFIKVLQAMLGQERHAVQLGAGREMALSASGATPLPREIPS